MLENIEAELVNRKLDAMPAERLRADKRIDPLIARHAALTVSRILTKPVLLKGHAQ
jgi:hypothetical protein